MSSVFRGFTNKISEKMKAADETLQQKLVGSFAQNVRLAASLEVAAEAFPLINDISLTPQYRVEVLDALIHATAVPSGRIKQTREYGQLIMRWERIVGKWQNFVTFDLLHPEEEEFPALRIPLKNGEVLVVRDRDSGSILSKGDHRARLSIRANEDIIPAGKFAWDWGISDDRDVSQQWALWIQQQPVKQAEGVGVPSMIPTQQLGGGRGQPPKRGGGEFAQRNPT